jgi:hypothetical protein
VVTSGSIFSQKIGRAETLGRGKTISLIVIEI